MDRFPFRTTTKFEVVAAHLQQFHGISRKLASKRLHKFKEINGLLGDDNVIFDYSGGLYHPHSLESMGTLTTGGAGEWA
jgi:hypothetical protein